MTQRGARCSLILCALLCTLRAVAYDLSVHVQNVHGLPIQGAYVWLNPLAPQWAQSDAGGNATFTGVGGGNYLVVARHPSYGRADPQYPLLPVVTNVTFVLPNRTSFRIASYNMLGFNGWSAAQETALAKIYWTAQPDIACVQEAPDDPPRFETFVNAYMHGYTTVVSSVGGQIHNGVLSFFPIDATYSMGNAVMTRDLFVTQIAVMGVQSTTFMSVHLKAGGNYSDGERRNEEATYIGEYCSNLFRQGELFILAGDMNDDPDYYREPSRVHPILAEAGAGLVELSATDDDGNNETYSTYARYDFIVPVTGLAAKVLDTYIVRTDTMDARPSWLAYSDSDTASDHHMVYADIEIVPEPAQATMTALLCGILFPVLRRRLPWN
jgi:endonuclease/exonuclease/phosphatase family metal-dependent hydrolase